jgi:hypothetical protein
MSEGNSSSPRPTGSFPPLDILNAARKAVPAVDYALAAAGVAAAGSIVTTFLGDGRAAIIILGGMLIAMILLLVFARLVASHESGVAPAGRMLVWAVTVFFCIFLLFTATAVAVGWPRAWASILHLEEASPIAKIAEKIDFAVAGPNIDAVNTLVGIATISVDAAERDGIVSILKQKLSYPVTRDYDRVARAIRRAIIAGIVKIRRGDIHDDFAHGELKEQDLPGADFNSANAAGVNFAGSFLIGSDFRNANLRGADLSSTSLRNVRFANADLHGANLAGADWFNAEGLEIDQLRQIDRSGLRTCPKSAGGGYSLAAFVAFADGAYGIPYASWSNEEQQQAARYWRIYSEPAGLCDLVAGG